ALVLMLVARWWMRRDEGAAIPAAAGLVLALGDFHVWATGGLETMTFAALVLGRVFLVDLRPPRMAGGLRPGLLPGAAVLPRPDGLLFALAGVVYPWLVHSMPRDERLRRALWMALPMTLLIGGQIAFKLAYYGEILPTAFYSKSALRPWWSQGSIYVGLWLARNWGVLPVALAAVVATWRRPPERARSDARFISGAGLLFVIYVMHSGGDFMFARRLIPALPLLFLG